MIDVVVDISQFVISFAPVKLYSPYTYVAALFFLMNQDASCCTLAYYTMQLALTVVGAAFLTELSLLEMAENN